MLHITNGDSAADVIRAARVTGDVLPWRDVLHAGPVPDVAFDELRAIRARFIGDANWGAFEAVLRGFSERDARLAQSASDDEVVLWFEHDLYDQLQLLQILDWFATHTGPGRLSLVCNTEYLGLSTGDRLRERFPLRERVTGAHLSLARRAWRAFRSEDPRAMTSLLREDTSVLPFVGPALRRHLEEFPSASNGLSRTEQQALDTIADGVEVLKDVFVKSHIEREEPIFLGDTSFADTMEALAREREPLVRIGPGEFLNRRAALTPAGRDVLARRRDRVALNGIEKWLGGVQLKDDRVWRWNGEQLTLSGDRGQGSGVG